MKFDTFSGRVRFLFLYLAMCILSSLLGLPTSAMGNEPLSLDAVSHWANKGRAAADREEQLRTGKKRDGKRLTSKERKELERKNTVDKADLEYAPQEAKKMYRYAYLRHKRKVAIEESSAALLSGNEDKTRKARTQYDKLNNQMKQEFGTDMDNGERGYLEGKLSMADLQAESCVHQARADEMEKIKNRTAEQQKLLDYHKGWANKYAPRRMKTLQDGLPSFPYGKSEGSKSKSPTQGAMNRCPKPGSQLGLPGFVGLPYTTGTPKIAQTYTLKGTATTKSGAQVASTKLKLPTVTAGYMVDPQLTPEAFLASSVVGTQGRDGTWSAGDDKPSVAVANVDHTSLQDLQIFVEVRFLTVRDKFFEKIGTDFDVTRSEVSEIDDGMRNSQSSAGSTEIGSPVLGSNVLLDKRFLTVTDDFLEGIGVDFDFELKDQVGGDTDSTLRNANSLGAFSDTLSEYSYTVGVGYGYDVGLFSIPLVNFIGRQQIEIPLAINDNPSQIYGLRDGVSPWEIVDDVEGSGLPIGGWTHAALPFGTTLGWQPAGEAGVLDDFIAQHGEAIAYQEPNAGTAGAPAAWDPRDWPITRTYPVPHLQLQKEW